MDFTAYEKILIRSAEQFDESKTSAKLFYPFTVLRYAIQMVFWFLFVIAVPHLLGVIGGVEEKQIDFAGYFACSIVLVIILPLFFLQTTSCLAIIKKLKN